MNGIVKFKGGISMLVLKILIYYIIIEISTIISLLIHEKYPIVYILWTPLTVGIGIAFLGPIAGILAWATHRLITVALVFYGRKV